MESCAIDGRGGAPTPLDDPGASLAYIARADSRVGDDGTAKVRAVLPLVRKPESLATLSGRGGPALSLV